MNNNFVHLHTHNEFSFLDGYGKAEQYAKKAKELGFTHLALTNHGNVDGVIKFQKACKGEDIKPIAGCEFYMVRNRNIKEKGEIRYHITALVKNSKGWQNILKMLTIANTEGFYRKPRIDDSTLLDHCEGLIIMSACSSSFIRAGWGEYVLKQLKRKINGDLYLEIMPHIMKEQIAINKKAIELGKKLNIPLVATNDCHYIEAKDSKTQEVLLAVQMRDKWNNPKRWRFDITGLHLRTAEEMEQAFLKQKAIPERIYKRAINRTSDIAEKCEEFEIKKLSVQLPKVPGYEGTDDTELLYELARKGFRQRITRKAKQLSKPVSEYRARMEEELGLICDLGFQRYFLIVWELISWCQGQDIMTGPGRGSVGGCLVAYLLRITNVDPLEYNLIFSRFISPARIDLPDIDMDFEDIKREEIRKHLEECYGKDNVAGISTFLSLKGRAALRDVARVFSVPNSDVDPASKSIVVRSGGDFRSDFSIEDAFETFEDGIKFRKKYPEVARLSMALEGQVRGVGKHAAGMCISSESLKDGYRCNICIRKDIAVANWDKHDAEYVGMMKLDVLGLSALTILNESRKMIKDNYGESINFDDIPMYNKKVYDEISKGNTIGAFQIGSMGLSKYCKELVVEDFNALVDATSLWRPGTLRSGMTTEFILRKHNKTKWEYPHPALEELTKDTYGIILYQEQVMRFMYDLGGLPWKTCDTVRKVISKSQGDELFLKFKKEFAEGCVKRGTLDKKTAERMWMELASFGCLTGDTVIYRVSSNQYVNRELTIKEAYVYQHSDNFKHRGLNILSMWGDGQVRYNRIRKIIRTGKKQVFYIRTSSNKSIKATSDHKFLVNNKWTKVSEMKIGDWLRCSNLILPNKIAGSGVGIGRFQTGYYTQNEQITEIKFSSIRETYDIEMEGEPRNFIASNIVTHNSYSFNKAHAVEYSMITYWDMHLKVHYPAEFMACSLTFGNQEKKEEYIEECKRLNLKIKLPKVGYSHPNRWKTDGENLYIPFSEIKGVASKTAELIENLMAKKGRGGFYKVEKIDSEKRMPNKAIIKNLELIKAFDKDAELGEEELEEIGELFSFNLSSSSTKRIKSIQELLGIENKLSDIDFTKPSKDVKAYIGTMAELKFGYRQNVLKARKAEGGIGDIKGTSESMGGAYGFFKDSTDSAMMVFNSKVYSENKFEVEHCQGKHLLIKATHPQKNSVMFCEKVLFEEQLLSCDLWPLEFNVIKKVDGYRNTDLKKCTKCHLIKECKAPVLPSRGIYDLMISGEAPGRDEDREGKGFTGKAGRDILWKEMQKYNLIRRFFHITNVAKCYPSKTRTPDKDSIKTCADMWLMEEIRNSRPALILAFGNTNVKYFKKQEGGITAINATTEWSNKANAWICWCVHPASVLYSPDNRVKFEQGIENFAKCINNLGGIEGKPLPITDEAPF